MNTICPKCKHENWNETVSVANNPNLITCTECRHSYFVEIIFRYKKAYKSEDGGYYTKNQLKELEENGFIQR